MTVRAELVLKQPQRTDVKNRRCFDVRHNTSLTTSRDIRAQTKKLPVDVKWHDSKLVLKFDAAGLIYFQFPATVPNRRKQWNIENSMTSIDDGEKDPVESDIRAANSHILTVKRTHLGGFSRSHANNSDFSRRMSVLTT